MYLGDTWSALREDHIVTSSHTTFILSDMKVWCNRSGTDSWRKNPRQGKKTEIPTDCVIFSFLQINGDMVQKAGFFLDAHIPLNLMVPFGGGFGVSVSHFESFCVSAQW